MNNEEKVDIPENVKELNQAVEDTIKRRRKNSVGQDAKITIQELRANDMATIYSQIKQHRSSLVPWTDILATAL